MKSFMVLLVCILSFNVFSQQESSSAKFIIVAKPSLGFKEGNSIYKLGQPISEFQTSFGIAEKIREDKYSPPGFIENKFTEEIFIEERPVIPEKKSGFDPYEYIGEKKDDYTKMDETTLRALRNKKNAVLANVPYYRADIEAIDAELSRRQRNNENRKLFDVIQEKRRKDFIIAEDKRRKEYEDFAIKCKIAYDKSYTAYLKSYSYISDGIDISANREGYIKCMKFTQSANVKTESGIVIGDSVRKVTKAYGLPGFEKRIKDQIVVIYKFGNDALTFSFANNKLVCIGIAVDYDAVVDDCNQIPDYSDL